MTQPHSQILLSVRPLDPVQVLDFLSVTAQNEEILMFELQADEAKELIKDDEILAAKAALTRKELDDCLFDTIQHFCVSQVVIHFCIGPCQQGDAVAIIGVTGQDAEEVRRACDYLHDRINGQYEPWKYKRLVIEDIR